MPGKNDDETNISRVKSLNGAIASENVLGNAVAGTGIDWTMIAAMGIRETGWHDVNQANGQGVGVFQIDLGQNPDVTRQEATNIAWAAHWAATTLEACGK